MRLCMDECGAVANGQGDCMQMFVDYGNEASRMQVLNT